VHQVHRRFRRRRLLRALGLDRGEDDLSLAEQADPRAGPDVLTELAQLDRVLNRLSPAQRVAWVLRYVEGQTLDEVAEACGQSLATIKRQIAAAQREIAALVAIPPWEDE
jgi:RNA polymerase sigma-70 factor (ECF subfamily)